MARRENEAELRRRSRVVIDRLRKAYPEATCALTHQSPLQLLVATILSAQCTDARVNLVTPGLFSRYPTVTDLAAADRTELESIIRSTGFYRNKAKSIQGAATRMESDFKGEVPRTMPELLVLPGVARKTANVVLGTAFGIADGFVVDTHVFRLAHRLGFAKGATPELVEQELMQLVPRKDWIDLAHILIHHGRAICTARNPACESCVVFACCPKIGVPAKKPTRAARSKTRLPLKVRIAASKKSRARAKP
ncbi:MAG: endonuclease III [Vicinamibacteria bacterium]